jgi:hypothetical protein
MFVARMTIFNATLNLSPSRRHGDGCESSNSRKLGGVVDSGTSLAIESG